MFNRLILFLLSRCPPVYVALRAIYRYRQLMRVPAQTPLGFKLAGPSAMEEGVFEPAETKQLSILLADVDVFVNVGANCGYYACLARKTGAKVVAIEPLDQNVQLLQRNLLANDWHDVEVLPVGLGDKTSLMKLYGGGTAASLVSGWAGASADHYCIVPVTTLDAILADRFAGQKLLILIDVEGFELNVLKGALRQMDRNPAPVWFVEICINEHQPQGAVVNPNLREIFDLFWTHGYVAEKAGCEVGPVSVRDIEKWTEGEALPATHNFLFRRV